MKNSKENYSLIIAIMVIVFMIGLDTSIVNIILPTLQEVFNISTPWSMSIVAIYLATMAAFQLLAGRCSDIFDAIDIVIYGVVIFTIGSFVCAIAGSLDIILVGRGIQGIGAAMITASFGAIVLLYTPKEKIGTTLGSILMVMSVGVTIGAPLGGILAQHFSWRLVFVINIPIALFSIFLLLKFLKQKTNKMAKLSLKESFSKLDIKGGLLSIVLFLSFPMIFTTVTEENFNF